MALDDDGMLTPADAFAENGAALGDYLDSPSIEAPATDTAASIMNHFNV